MPKVDGSESGVDRLLRPLYGPPVELPIIPEAPDPCEGMMRKQKQPTGADIRSKTPNRRPGDDPCYEDT